MAVLDRPEEDQAPPPFVPPRLGSPFRSPDIAAAPVEPPRFFGDLARFITDPLERAAFREFYGEVPLLGGAQRFGLDVAELSPLFFSQRQRTVNPTTGELLEDPTIMPIGGGLAAGFVGKAGKAAKAAKGTEDIRLQVLRAYEERMAALRGPVSAPVGRVVAPAPAIERAAEILRRNPQSADKYAGNVNLQRINAPEAVKDQIRLAQSQIPRAAPQTHDETRALANEIVLSAKATGKDPVDLARSLAERQLKREEVTAIRIAALEQSTVAANAARAAVARGRGAEDIAKTKAEILKQLSMQETLSGVTREAGGTFDSFNIIVDAPNGRWNEALTKVGGLRQNQDFVDLLSRMDPTDQPRISKFIRDVETQLQKQGAKELPPADWKWWLNHVYINGIMSGLSNVRNLIGNSLKTAKTLPELYGATLLPGGPQLSEVNAFTGALFTRGLSRGVAKASHVFAHRVTEDFAKLDEPYKELMRYPTNFVGARTADLVGVPSRIMLAVDGFYKGMFEEGFKAFYAAREATELGLTGVAREAFVADRIVNPTVETLRRARLGAAEYTFNAPPSEFVSNIMKLRNSKWLPGAKLVVTFINTPANVLLDAIQMTPLGLIGARGAKGAFGESETAVRYSRAILGSAAMIGIYTQMVEGNITGYNPYRPGTTEWDIWNKDNLEVSVKTPWGDMSLLNYPPMSTIFKMVASIQDTQRKYGEDAVTPELLGRIALRIAQTTFDESFFSGIANIYDAIESPDRAMKGLVRQMISAPIPYSGALRLVNQVRGLPPRDPITFGDYLATNIPLLADTLRPKIGALGEAEPRTNVGPLALLPSRVQQPHADDFERRLLYLKDFGLTLPEPLQRDVGRGVKLTDDELYELKKNTYPKVLDALHATMSKSDFASQPEQEQIRRLRGAFDAARNDGKVETALVTLLPRAKTPDEVARVALVGLGSYSRQSDKAKWIEDIRKAGKMTAAAARAIDDARPVKAPGMRPDPTVAEYLRFAPRIRQYLAAKPFLIGTPEEWRRVEQARREYASARSVNARAPKPALVRKYDLASIRNPRRAQLLKLTPGLDRFVSDSTYLWQP